MGETCGTIDNRQQMLNAKTNKNLTTTDRQVLPTFFVAIAIVSDEKTNLLKNKFHIILLG